MKPCSVKQYEFCREQFGQIAEKLDRLDKAIRGNGETLGIRVRLDRLESSATTRSRLLWIIAASTLTLGVGAAWRLVLTIVGA